MDEGSLQRRRRQWAEQEDELASRAEERAARARGRAESAEGTARDAHLRAAVAQDLSMRAHLGAANEHATTSGLTSDEMSMQARKRRRIALELDLADRATERATGASRRAATAVGLVRLAHQRAAEAQDRAARAHKEAADVQRNHLALEQELHGRMA